MFPKENQRNEGKGDKNLVAIVHQAPTNIVH